MSYQFRAGLDYNAGLNKEANGRVRERSSGLTSNHEA